ncbi:MAG: S8 family peptidase, partial [Syntrophales bacterium]
MSAESLQQMNRIASGQDELLSSLTVAGPRTFHTYTYTPYIFMEVDGPGLQELLASPLVDNVQEDVAYPPTLNLSVPRIGAPSLWSSGYKGAGVVAAVLDTGVDKNHPFIAGSVVSEACYSSNNAGYSATSVCPGGVTSSTATGSAMPYAGNCPAGECDHGTHVTGIVAGRQGVYDSLAGAAPEASILAIQVFSRFDSTTYCGTGNAPCALSFTSDQLKGLERVYALRSSYTISSVNMSLGGGQYYSNCDSNPLKPIIDNLRAAGIATVISSGNSYYCGSMGAPGCISSAISVGATTDVDAVSSYSNSASFLSLLAPGSSINSSVPGGTYQSWNGTSMAAPHVTGAWALLKQAKPAATVNQVLTAFTSTGLSVTDTGKCPSVTKKRIDVSAALNYLGGTPVANVTLTPNLSSPRPVGTSVTFTAAASGGSGSYQYYFTYRTPAGTWKAGRAYSSTPTWAWN